MTRIARRIAVAAIATVLSSLFMVPASGSSSFSKTETITRDHLVNGADNVVDSRTFHVTVDQTTQLRDRQEVNVSWSGAHPTGGLIGDENSGLAAQQEYPVVLMECRGVDSATVPASKRLSPETCWTHTPLERSQSDQAFNFPPYRLDRYASPADRQARVGVPSPFPSDCISFGSGIQHWIPFVAADGTSYAGGPSGCAGVAPDAVTYEGQLQPSNTTYAATDRQGNGSASFVISTSESNASLGCSNTVACSLVVIPIMGISCDPAGANLPPADQPPQDAQDEAMARCSASGQYQPGEFSPGTQNAEDLAVSGLLWWSESNWQNRISVPLTFSQPANICNSVNDSAPLYIYGSELMTQATLQWSPAFCLDPKLFKFTHVQTGEPQAKSLLQNGTIEAAFEGGPPPTPYGRPVVQAPTALTGFAITFVIDDATGHPMHTLRLTPRLLAKLLTESYPAAPIIKGPDAALSNNPLNLAEDPEFRALNPGPPAAGYNTEPAATLFSLSSDSDVIYALTSYINADPDARAWLNGKPDPWGMVVNPAYKGIKLPVDGWPLLDTFASGALYSPDHNPCLAADPVPFLPLVAAPVSTLAQITLNMQFGIANSQIICKNPGDVSQKLGALGRENPGQRFIVGLTTLADAERYQLDTASLLTHTDSGAVDKFSDATGRTFASPTDASLRAAAKMLEPNGRAGSWVLPYDQLRTASGGEGAYPGTMLVSTAIPTKGLPTKDAQRYAKFLRFAVTQGQRSGLGNGELPPGYLPLTSSDGMGSLAQYTQLAADAVEAQKGSTVSVVTLKTSTPGGGSPGGSSNPPPGGGSTGGPTTGSTGGSVPPGPSTTPNGPEPVLVVPAAGTTLAFVPGLGGLVAPSVLALGVFFALAAGGAWYFGRPKVSR